MVQHCSMITAMMRSKGNHPDLRRICFVALKQCLFPFFIGWFAGEMTNFSDLSMVADAALFGIIDTSTHLIHIPLEYPASKNCLCDFACAATPQCMLWHRAIA